MPKLEVLLKIMTERVARGIIIFNNTDSEGIIRLNAHYGVYEQRKLLR